MSLSESITALYLILLGIDWKGEHNPANSRAQLGLGQPVDEPVPRNSNPFFCLDLSHWAESFLWCESSDEVAKTIAGL